MLRRGAIHESMRSFFFAAALALLSVSGTAWADPGGRLPPSAGARPAAAPLSTAHLPPVARPEPDLSSVGLTRSAVDVSAARTILEGQVTSAAAKMPAGVVSELRRNAQELSGRLDGAQVNVLHYRNETVGLEVLTAGGMKYRMTWPLAGTLRFFRQQGHAAPYRVSVSAIEGDARHTLEAREPGVRELPGTIVLRSVRDPSSKLSGPGPDFTRGVRTIEAADGTHQTLPPAFVKRATGEVERVEDLNPPRALTQPEKARALEMMINGAHDMSRTASAGTTPTLVKATDAKVLSTKADENIAAAAKFVLENYEKLPINMRTAVKLHDMITAGIEERYNQPEKLKRLETFFRWTDSDAGRELAESDPVAFAERLHYYVVSLDTLDGGNGRTGRLLVDLVLLQHGLSPARYGSRDDYYAKASPEWGATVRQSSKLAETDERVRYFRECVAGGEAFVKEPVATLH